MGKFIAQEVRGVPNTILAGDFNVKERTQTIGLIEQHLVNVFKGELKTTINMRPRKENPNFVPEVIDMVFVSPTIRVLSKSCPDIDISDHLPLIVELEV